MKLSLSFLAMCLLAGCAHRVATLDRDSSLDQAASLSDRIEDKAIVVEQYLKASH